MAAFKVREEKADMLERYREALSAWRDLGLPWDAALRAVTLGAAEALGVSDRVGSLQAGRDGNVVVWSGDPFEPSSRVQAVMLNGKFVVGDVK